MPAETHQKAVPGKDLADAQQICLGDIVQMKKPHPCGSNAWRIIRTGADIKIKCLQCGRIVMLSRDIYLQRLKKVIERAQSQAE